MAHDQHETRNDPFPDELFQGERGGDDLFEDDLLNLARGGLLGRRAHRLVYFIESQVVFHKEQLRWACRILLGKERLEWTTRDVFSGFEVRDLNRPRVVADDLERLAPQWGRLLPDFPRLRAMVAHRLAQKYRLKRYHLPQVIKALGLDSDAVRDAYETEYGQIGNWWNLEVMEDPLDPKDTTPDQDALAEDILAREAEWLSVSGGDVVVKKGDPMDCFYVVASGRLRSDPSSPEQKEQRDFARGDVLGEVHLLAGVPWKSTVRAVRDGELVRVSRDSVMKLLEDYPKQGIELTKGVVARAVARNQGLRASALTIALIPLNADRAHEVFAEQFAERLTPFGSVMRVDARAVDDAVTAGASSATPGDDLDGMVASWLSMQETHHQYVIYEADRELSPWTERCIRQADRVIVVARANTDPGLRPVERRLGPESVVDLVLLHDPVVVMPNGTAAWLAHRNVRFHHHARIGDQNHAGRVARIVSGNALGIVCGGGGARGFVHPGVIRAFEEHGVAPDLYGGSSMGAVGAGLAALGWSADQIRRLGERLPKRSVLFDYTLPLMSITAGRRLTAFLRSVFLDVNIEDIWTPFFCVSTNLTRGGIEIHRKGPIWKAVRASVAIPGIFSPVLHQGNVLVDGAVLNNLPVDIMRDQWEAGTVIGVMTRINSTEFGPYEFELDLSGWKILRQRLTKSRQRLKVPSILGILLRSFDIKDARSTDESSTHRFADILIEPNTTGLGFLDFTAYNELAESGYIAAQKVFGDERIAERLYHGRDMAKGGRRSVASQPAAR